MKKMLKYLSIALFCSFFAFMFLSESVEANYDSSKNSVNIAVSKNGVKITVRYQRGINRDYATYKWCQRTNANTESCSNDIGGSVNYIDIGGDYSSRYIAVGDPEYVDNNITTDNFVVPKEEDPFLDNIEYKVDSHYSIVVNHYFCSIREEGNNSCEYYDSENTQTVFNVSGNDLINGLSLGGTGEVTDGIADEGLKDMMSKIYDIVHNTVMPIIWGILGLFLVVKGSLLGVQIVKSADEPQVRQEKVGSLKWLVIGVAIAYASSFLVDVVMGFFKDAFK